MSKNRTKRKTKKRTQKKQKKHTQKRTQKKRSQKRTQRVQKKYTQNIIACRQVPSSCNRKSCTIRAKKCISKGRVYPIPRLYSRNQCKKMRKKGFTQRASCAPYRV